MADSIDNILSRYPQARREDLVPILQEVQEAVGYLTEESVVKVGRFLNLSTSKIYGIATFYNQFSFETKGKIHFQVCHGTTCHVAGSKSIIHELEKLTRIKQGETSRDGMYSIEIVSCMGACGKAPVLAINSEYYIQLHAEDIKDLLNLIRNQMKEQE